MKPPYFKAAVTVLAVLFVSACLKLDGLAAYSAASSGTMSTRVLVDGVPATVQRRNIYRDGGEKPLADARVNAKRLEKVQGIYQKYFLALDALAKKDLTEYKTQFGGFEKSLAGSGLTTKSEASAITKLLRGIVSLGADAYRQKALTDVIETVDPTLQRGMRELKELNANYRTSLNREDAASQSAMEESIAAGAALDPPQPPYLARSLRAQQESTIRSEIKKSEAFDKAVSAIADGHKMLLRDSRNLRGKEAFEALKPKVKEISDAYKELSK